MRPPITLSVGGADRRLPDPMPATPLMVPATSVPVLVCHVLVVVTRPLPVRVDMTSNVTDEPMAVDLTTRALLWTLTVRPRPALVMALLRLVAIDVSVSLL